MIFELQDTDSLCHSWTMPTPSLIPFLPAARPFHGPLLIMS